MAKTRIKFVYEKETGEYKIWFDQEMEGIMITRHNQRHDQLVRKFVGEDPEISILKNKTEITSDTPEEVPSQKKRKKISQNS